MRGDEPAHDVAIPPECEEFPTCVGMNRQQNLSHQMDSRVPHMRGDEPAEVVAMLVSIYRVPHMRGDEPNRLTGRFGQVTSSPHAWG